MLCALRGVCLRMLLRRPRDAFTMINVDHRSLKRTVLEVHQIIEIENVVILHVSINKKKYE
jgi:hypothetical protein